MYSLLFLACSSFLLSLVLTPLCRNLFRRLGVVDHPDDRRKAHAQPVPHLGGIPIALSYLAACGLLLLSPLKGGALVGNNLGLAWKLLPAAGLVFGAGLLDDLFGLRPWQKLAGQLLGALAAYGAGVRVLGIAGFSTESWWGLPLTLLWLVGCTNAFNLIDGMDGLATGVGLFATVTMVLAALLLQNNIPLALATVPLAGCLLGFLRYNFNPASIFLGDSGSLLIGFLLGCFGVIWSQKSATLLGMTAPLMALAVPILDVGLSIARRFLRHQPIFHGDRGHIHHRLLDRGLRPRSVVLVLYGFCGLAAAFSLVQSAAHSPAGGAVLVVFCAITWMGIQHLGYAEFDVARRMLLGGTFQTSVHAQLSLRSFEQALTSAASFEECWTAIRDACQTFGFHEVRMSVGGTVYSDRFRAAGPAECWDLLIRLSARDYIHLSRAYRSPVLPMIVAPMADVLRHVLPAKLQAFEDKRSLSAERPQTPALQAAGGA